MDGWMDGSERGRNARRVERREGKKDSLLPTNPVLKPFPFLFI